MRLRLPDLHAYLSLVLHFQQKIALKLSMTFAICAGFKKNLFVNYHWPGSVSLNRINLHIDQAQCTVAHITVSVSYRISLTPIRIHAHP